MRKRKVLFFVMTTLAAVTAALIGFSYPSGFRLVWHTAPTNTAVSTTPRTEFHLDIGNGGVSFEYLLYQSEILDPALRPYKFVGSSFVYFGSQGYPIRRYSVPYPYFASSQFLTEKFWTQVVWNSSGIPKEYKLVFPLWIPLSILCICSYYTGRGWLWKRPNKTRGFDIHPNHILNAPA